jgi:hypothetical protein
VPDFLSSNESGTTHQLLAYADDVNLLGDNIDTINKNRQTLIDAIKEVGLEVNVENTKYMLVSRDQNAGQTREIKIGNISFENVSQFKYLGTTVTNQNLIQEEIKKRLNSGNACYHSAQNILSSRLLSKMKVRIYKTIILPVVVYGCETWFLTVRKEVESSCELGNESSGSIKCWELPSGCTACGLSSGTQLHRVS